MTVVAGRSGNGAGMISWPRCGAHDRQRASASFQQFGQVYCRHDMQKLNVLWKASSWWAVSSRSVSLRAAAIASSIEVSSDRTKFLSPRESDLDALEADARARGFEGVARATPFAERFGQDLGHRVPGYRADDARAACRPKRVESIAQDLERPSTGRTAAAGAECHG